MAKLTLEASVLKESAAPTTGATEAGLFVSDGTGGLTAGHLYVRPPSSGASLDLTTVASGAGTTPTIVQSAANTGGTATITLGAAPTSGHLLVAMSFNPTVSTAGSGWTLQLIQSNGTDFGFVLTKVAGAGESATQQPIASAPGTGALVIWELSGQAATFFVAAASQVEQVGPIVIGPQLPNIVNMIALHGMGAIDTITATYNLVVDVLDNTGTRKALAGHSFAPGVAQVIGRVSSTGGYKVVSCLITA